MKVGQVRLLHFFAQRPPLHFLMTINQSYTLKGKNKGIENRQDFFPVDF